MAASKITQLICYDDHRNFTGDLKKKFSDETRYLVTSIHNTEQYIDYCEQIAKNNFCVIAIIGFTESVDKITFLNEFLEKVNNVMPDGGTILLVQSGNLQEVKDGISQSVDAVIPINNNTVLRIHNAVKRFISEYNIVIFKRRRNRALTAVMVFMAFMIAALFFFLFRYPVYF